MYSSAFEVDLKSMGLKLGDTLKLGQANVTIRATIDEEPDRLALVEAALAFLASASYRF